MPTALVTDSRFLEHDTGFPHPESPQRLATIAKALDADPELQKKLVRVEPRSATESDITACHQRQLLDRLAATAGKAPVRIEPDTVVCAESFEVSLLAAGGALAAVDAVVEKKVRNVFVLVRPPGHHATPARSMGFCLFNNVAIAARYAQRRYGIDKILIIDWDVHHGNGTQDIFASDPSVFYLSTHQYPWYPGTGAANEEGEGRGRGYTINVPLPAGTDARKHTEYFREALSAAVKKLPPELILISAGFDAHRDDPLAGLMLEDSHFEEFTRSVMDAADRYCDGRIVSALEGGYNLHTLGETVRRHIAALTEAS